MSIVPPVNNVDINQPAQFLEGKILNDGWIIKSKIIPNQKSFGRNFSVSYLVEKDGKPAILKALDFSIALLDTDPATALSNLLKTYDFEKELLELCEGKRLSKIVNILSRGTIPALPGSIIQVPYFILEYSEKDLRSQLDVDSRLDIAWLLRILHNVTVGLWQLHGQGVALKNLRPENIMAFSKQLQKLSELGNADRKGISIPEREQFISHDPSYLTPEAIYGHEEKDWMYKSQSSDIYNLGNLIFFLFTQTNVNTWLTFYLNESHRPGNWSGSHEGVLPYLIDAYDTTILHFSAYIEDEKLRTELETTLRQLCHPDPKLRGHPKNLGMIGTELSVERYISQFDRLAKQAELGIL
ncbi:hypothetical protein BH11BAC7_BH11BAC7_00760 [soil metagenome]